MSDLNRARKSVSIASGTMQEPPTETTILSCVVCMSQARGYGSLHHTPLFSACNVGIVLLCVLSKAISTARML
jgi:hypothetical protein